MSLKKRRLGKTNLMLTEIGFGAGPPGIEDLHESEFIDALTQALDAGINFVDTARLYGHSESLIGKVIQERGKDEFYLASKTLSRDRQGAMEDIHASLRNLYTDKIDLYMLHDPDQIDWERAMGKDGALEALKEAREHGLIDYTGISCHTTLVLNQAVDSGEFDSIVVAYNPFSRETEEIISLAKERDIGVVIMKPLGGQGILDALTIAECETIMSPRELLRYVLSNPDVTVAIPGMKFSWEVKENVELACSYAPMSPEEKSLYDEEADGLLTKVGKDYCRGCNYRCMRLNRSPFCAMRWSRAMDDQARCQGLNLSRLSQSPANLGSVCYGDLKKRLDLLVWKSYARGAVVDSNQRHPD